MALIVFSVSNIWSRKNWLFIIKMFIIKISERLTPKLSFLLPIERFIFVGSIEFFGGNSGPRFNGCHDQNVLFQGNKTAPIFISPSAYLSNFERDEDFKEGKSGANPTCSDEWNRHNVWRRSLFNPWCRNYMLFIMIFSYLIALKLSFFQSQMKTLERMKMNPGILGTIILKSNRKDQKLTFFIAVLPISTPTH